ncbi:hypothetical protein [Alteromonas hispanica]|uniref:Uncharacterized protein n=1 Tax=Alteromonas hispanica TaxID=315421 RepID=A0A6L9MPE4_9ALTE|nr:hypothetical protein [Alteromonas hispanica]NDW20006.1 hypothetical protein [Alteromonas hispanica]
MEDRINCESEDKKSPSERLFDSNAKVLIWIAIGFFVFSIVIYGVRFWGYQWGETEQFSQFGDFLGGTLNPLLSFITILLLVLSIRYQLEELRLTRFEIGKQLEEQQANNDIQLKIAELNEKSLILPALAESITR